ncbi:maleylpyruvate isomerase family mycothiol-dependent enzyme [Kibdelosporangium philippinense]|uniref:Maleylpyruvate isomerase family mycothiol-dependent enzyme n=1 Tax=Kibdelosporangium philippinense TaxID=211113 RepID=A0ABS8ZLE5_9PSEU|nr:maleylpyruvate isomerase family mycothiol-dependent enzyme [Kibdelosporangium philippinense]MCE7007278.1 maleylpyruvate isomerase family mycothiol-dependent enzyme [Kibdelosporangium philippinense]
MEIFDDLEAEYDRLDGIFATLTADQWMQPSAADGWSNVDVLLHLAQSEEIVTATVNGTATRDRGAMSVDEAMDLWVRADRAGPEVVYPRWQAARRSSVQVLRSADPAKASAWVSAPLRPATMATTRLAEHWAHALDITGPLNIPYPDTDRLRHIARLGHRTLPYAFQFAGHEFVPIRAELSGPDGTSWRFGPDDAESVINGPVGAFCRVGAQRLRPEDSGLTTSGPHAALALRLLRNYAA